MPISPVDYNPFAAQYGEPDQFTRPSGQRPPAQLEPEPFVDAQFSGRQQRMNNDPGVRTARGMIQRGQEAEQDTLFRDLRSRFINNPQAMSMLKYLESQQRYESQVAKTMKAAQLRPTLPMDTLPPDPSSAARPDELQQYRQQPLRRLEPMERAQRIQDPSSAARPDELQQYRQQPMQRIQPPSAGYRPGGVQTMGQEPARQARLPSIQSGSGIPQQQKYESMRPRPGMVVNGYRLVNPSKPNDRSSWQPVTEK